MVIRADALAKATIDNEHQKKQEVHDNRIVMPDVLEGEEHHPDSSPEYAPNTVDHQKTNDQDSYVEYVQRVVLHAVCLGGIMLQQDDHFIPTIAIDLTPGIAHDGWVCCGAAQGQDGLL